MPIDSPSICSYRAQQEPDITTHSIRTNADPPTRDDLSIHLESEGEAILIARTAGVEQALAHVYFEFAEQQKAKINQHRTDLDRQEKV